MDIEDRYTVEGLAQAIWLDQTVHRRFQDWVRSKVLEQVLLAVAQDLTDRGGLLNLFFELEWVELSVLDAELVFVTLAEVQVWLVCHREISFEIVFSQTRRQGERCLAYAGNSEQKARRPAPVWRVNDPNQKDS